MSSPAPEPILVGAFELTMLARMRKVLYMATGGDREGKVAIPFRQTTFYCVLLPEEKTAAWDAARQTCLDTLIKLGLVEPEPR